jgi:non-ribosomal peptide synthetase component F
MESRMAGILENMLPPRFAADAMLGRLGRWLRVLGFDTSYDAALADAALVRLANEEARILLTRDRHLLRELRPLRAHEVRQDRTEASRSGPAPQSMSALAQPREIHAGPLARYLPFSPAKRNLLMDPAIRRQTIADLLHRTAKRHPNKPGLICGDTRWTFAEFDAVVDRVATGLSRMNVGHASRVAVLARNSHGFAALRFALARLGAVLVPINFMLKADEVAYILKHAGAQTLATDSGLAEVARSAAAMDTAVKQFIWLPSEDPSQPVAGMTSFDDLAQTEGAAPETPQLASTDLAQIVYTSGTESSPKGAMLTHDAVISQYASCAVDASIAHGDVMLHALPL